MFEIPTLKPEDIEVKIKQITSKGALALLYKTARTDMEYLDKYVGAMNWQCQYEEIKGNLYCTISIWDDEKKQWIHKQDCGIESREDDEGNQKKGEASDAFKRASTKASGCGRELYSSPFIWLNVETEQDKNGKWQLVDRFAKYEVVDIDYDPNRKIIKLVISNAKTGDVVYRYGGTAKAKPKQEKPAPKAPQKQETEQVEGQAKSALASKVNAVVETSATIPNPNAKAYEKVVKAFLEQHKIDRKVFAEWRAMAVRAGKKVTQKKFTELTSDEWILLIATMENLYDEGFFNNEG